ADRLRSVDSGVSVEEIRTYSEQGIDVVALVGEWDLANVERVNAALRHALSDETRSCILDLSAVEFMDSSMVHALIRWSKEAQLSEREAFAIMIAGPQTPVARTLAVSGVLKRLPCSRHSTLPRPRSWRGENRAPNA